MDSILATAGRLITPPRQPRPGRLDRWTVVLGSIISLFGLLLQAQAASSVTLAWNPSGASGIAGHRPTAHWSIGSGLGKRQGAHVIWILNNGVFQYAISLPNVGGGWHVVGAGDFNGGGQADLVWENATTGLRVIWIMKDGGFVSSISLGTINPSWHIAAVGDFLGNGQSDLVWENTTTGQRAIWLMKNGVHSSSISLPTVQPQWHIVDH